MEVGNFNRFETHGSFDMCLKDEELLELCCLDVHLSGTFQVVLPEENTVLSRLCKRFTRQPVRNINRCPSVVMSEGFSRVLAVELGRMHLLQKDEAKALDSRYTHW